MPALKGCLKRYLYVLRNPHQFLVFIIMANLASDKTDKCYGFYRRLVDGIFAG